MMESRKSPYDHTIYDAEVEQRFAQDMEANEEVRVYAKLPGWFKIDTPLGTYNPDWAVLIEVDGQDRLYFVIETKGDSKQETRPKEQAKIKCGEEHFKALKTEVHFETAPDYEELSRIVEQ